MLRTSADDIQAALDSVDAEIQYNARFSSGTHLNTAPSARKEVESEKEELAVASPGESAVASAGDNTGDNTSSTAGPSDAGEVADGD